jgi:hypothetical protein
MKKMNENQMKNLEGGKFWGWSCGPAWYTPTGECYQTCTHYILWMENGTDTNHCGVH